MTVTVQEHVALLPLVSVASQLIGFVPIDKTAGDRGLHDTLGELSTASVAFAVQE